MFTNMSYEQFNAAIRPKVQGSLNVAQLLLPLTQNLDFFVMLSSSAAVIGNRGQANYSAANAFMDSFAKSLRQQGVPATTISLGSIVSVGWLAENSIPVALSYDTIDEDRLLAILEYHMDPRWFTAAAAVSTEEHCHTVAGLRSSLSFERESVPLPDFMSYPLFSQFLKTAATTKSGGRVENVINGASLTSSLKSATSLDKAASLITRATIAKVSRTMLIAVEDLDPTRSMASYGVDSLVAVDLRSWFNRHVGASFTTDEILGELSMADLAHAAAKSSSLLPEGIS